MGEERLLSVKTGAIHDAQYARLVLASIVWLHSQSSLETSAVRDEAPRTAVAEESYLPRRRQAKASAPRPAVTNSAIVPGSGTAFT
jgi:hypothetical protein